MRRLGQLASLALVLSGVPAMAQQYYGATVGVGDVSYQDANVASDCHQTSSASVFDIIVGAPYALFETSLPLLMVNGTWVPALASSIDTLGRLGPAGLEYISTLSADGVVTTHEFGSGTDPNSGSSYNYFSTERIDLNTGNYTWHRMIHTTSSSACPIVDDDMEDYSGHVPITLSKTTAPNQASISIVDPLAPYVNLALMPASITASEVPYYPAAAGLAADGAAVVAIVYRSSSNAQVTFTLSAPTAVGLFGALSQFESNYPSSPSPGTEQKVPVDAPFSPDPDGNYTFLALLWAPSQMPVTPSVSTFPFVDLTVTATQSSLTPRSTSVHLLPPPLLLVHGVWSSADEAWPAQTGFRPWIGPLYPHTLIFPVDYGSISYKTFSDAEIQSILLRSINDALANAAQSAVAARRVDVVAHSMGGLVTRYFMAHPPSGTSLPTNPVHMLITIGTPHQGTPLTSTLDLNASQGNQLGLKSWIAFACAFHLPPILPCALANFFDKSLHKKVDSATLAMEPNSTDLASISSATFYRAIIGQAPTLQPTPTPGAFSDYAEGRLNYLVSAFVPPIEGTTISGIMGTSDHDTIVPGASQQGTDPNAVTIAGIVHTNLGSLDIGETRSPDFWSQALFWLTGGSRAAPTASPDSRRAFGSRPKVLPSPAPNAVAISDLTGYTQVDPSNASLSPASGSPIPINSATNITATSTTKTIIQFLLLQQAADPTDVLSLYTTQSPFSIAFTPIRLGSADFVAFVLFSDMTFVATTLQYTLQPVGAPAGLNLIDAPAASLAIGTSAILHARGLFSSGPIDVTQAATYNTRAANSPVFSVSPGGTITAIGTGIDILDVSYSSVSASAPIAVGACTFTLAPLNQIVPFGGGSVNVQVTTTPGCGWTADGGDTWLAFTSASGSGSGTITLTATANTSGATQVAFVTLAGHNVAITQPATACSYSVSTAAISVASSGASGTIAVTTSCPVVASSDVSWIVPVALSSSVDYTVAGNTSTARRTASLTIGTQSISVTQAGLGSYLVGDVFPSTGDTAGNFGDGSINTLDLLAVLRAITNIPGALPAACSDLFDAMDVFPLDTANQRGGDGVLNTLDLLALLRRVTNIDTSRPTRTSLGLSCSSASAQAVRSPDQYAGALFVGPLVNGQRPVYLLADQALSLAGFSLGLGVGNTRIQFVSAPGLSPSLVDTEVPGVLAAAWLNGLSLPAGERVLLGYIGAPEGSVKLFGASGNAADTGRTVHFRLQEGQAQ